MAVRVGLTKLQRGVLGALYALLLVATLFLGAALRDCTHDFNLLLQAVLIDVTFGIVLTIPAAIAGFIIGYNVRFRMRPIWLVVCALSLCVLVVCLSYALLPRSPCLPEF